MPCPFLNTKNVKYCGLCRLTMIPLDAESLATEQCAGPGYRECALLKERHTGPLPDDRCPHLCVGNVSTCGAAPVRKLIPCNEATSSRCADDRHKYCQIYLTATEHAGDVEVTDDATSIFDVEDHDEAVPLPATLSYAPNHMWIDRGDEQCCHVGVDAFFAHALGRVDEVLFRNHAGSRQPVVTFRVDGVELDMAFPCALKDLEVNTHLVSDPSLVLRDPYGRGWLFEGGAIPADRPGLPDVLSRGFMKGEAARDWMASECGRLTEFVTGYRDRADQGCGVLLQDGGGLPGHLAGVLDRSALVRLHAEFFAFDARRLSAAGRTS